MDILNANDLQQRAHQALRRGREPQKLTLAYAGISLTMGLAVFFLNLWLDAQISGTGGLRNLGTRAIFSTIQQALPILSSFVLMCLELGFLSGMMRISRGQYADHTDLKVGFEKFWPLFRLSLIQMLVYCAVAFIAMQIGSAIFLLTPWAEPLMEVLYPLYESQSLLLTEELMNELLELMLPMFLVVGVVLLALLVPVLFRMRMAYFCLLEDPRGRAMAAIRESSRMMRRRFGQMLKIDLRLWSYYLVTVAVLVVLYLDVILAMLGVSLPVSAKALAAAVYFAAAGLQFVCHMFLRPRAEITYLLAYDRLREKPKDDGVVLGNIFDM